jgi:ubiquinone/menaquinone biosynthesis C-methylase UbiE
MVTGNQAEAPKAPTVPAVSGPDTAAGKFDAVAATYEHSVLQPLLYLPVQQRALRLAQRLMPHPRRILDVGCGTGRLLRQARQQHPAAMLIGIDPAWAMVATATTASPPELAIRHLRAAAERLPFAASVFDLVVATMALRHWNDTAAAITEIHRVLAPGGVFVVADLFPTYPRRSPPLTVLRRRSRDHGNPPAGLAAALATHGLPVVACQRMPWVCLPDVQIVAAQKGCR